MSYTNQTVHYGIPLPQQTDLVNGLDWNTSSEAIDGALYDATQIANTLKSDMEEVKEDIVDLKAEDVKIETSATELTARVATNEQNIAEQIKDIQNLYDLTSANNEQSATSSRDYAVGEYFIYNDVLYKCTVAITKGDTIVPNVNCSATNTTTEINSKSNSVGSMICDTEVVGTTFATDMLKGALFRHDGDLYVTLADVKAGDSIDENTNCMVTTVENVENANLHSKVNYGSHVTEYRTNGSSLSTQSMDFVIPNNGFYQLVIEIGEYDFTKGHGIGRIKLEGYEISVGRFNEAYETVSASLPLLANTVIHFEITDITTNLFTFFVREIHS